MISRLCACIRGCAGLLGEVPAVLVLSLTCPSKGAPAGYSKVDLVSSSILQSEHCVIHWSLSMLTGGGEMASPCLLILGQVIPFLLQFRKLSQKNNLPFCVQGFHQNLVFTLSASELSSFWQYNTPVFYLMCMVGLHTPNFRTPSLQEATLILWESISLHCGWCCFVQENQSHDCTGAGILW